MASCGPGSRYDGHEGGRRHRHRSRAGGLGARPPSPPPSLLCVTWFVYGMEYGRCHGCTLVCVKRKLHCFLACLSPNTEQGRVLTGLTPEDPTLTSTKNWFIKRNLVLPEPLNEDTRDFNT